MKIKTAIKRLPWPTLETPVLTVSLFARVKRGVSCWGWSSGLSVKKISYSAQTKTKIAKMQTHNTNSDIQR